MKTETYKYDSEMIAAAVAAGYKHVGGRGFKCNGCGNKTSMRKFIKNGRFTHACNKCGYRKAQ